MAEAAATMRARATDFLRAERQCTATDQVLSSTSTPGRSLQAETIAACQRAIILRGSAGGRPSHSAP